MGGFESYLLTQMKERMMRVKKSDSRRKKIVWQSVHGSIGSPRTDHDATKINKLALRPEHVEGRIAT
jgi:hypothetical protein